MSLFYSKSTGGFFDSGIHGGLMPTDVVPVTQAAHDALMIAQAAGKMIIGDATGNPIAADRPAPTQAERNASTKGKLAALDALSIRALREWIAEQPNAPQFTRDHEATAQALRATLV